MSYENEQIEIANNYHQKIQGAIDNIKYEFIYIGLLLYEVQVRKLYYALGYDSIVEYASNEFDIGKSTCYNLININCRFCSNGNRLCLDDRFNNYSYSQLSELVTVDNKDLNKFSSTMSVSEIKELKKHIKGQSSIKPDSKRLESDVCSFNYKINNVSSDYEPFVKNLLYVLDNAIDSCGNYSVVITRM